jgi:hypothetical protein
MVIPQQTKERVWDDETLLKQKSCYSVILDLIKTRMFQIIFVAFIILGIVAGIMDGTLEPTIIDILYSMPALLISAFVGSMITTTILYGLFR